MWAVVFGAGAMTLSLYTLHVILRTPLFFPDDNPETFWLHVVVVTAIGAGFRLAHGSPGLDRQPPTLGEHTDEILRAAGYGAAEIEALRRDGVI